MGYFWELLMRKFWSLSKVLLSGTYRNKYVIFDMEWAGPNRPGQNVFHGNREKALQLTAFSWDMMARMYSLVFDWQKCVLKVKLGRVWAGLVVISRISWRAWFVFQLLLCIQHRLSWVFCSERLTFPGKATGKGPIGSVIVKFFRVLTGAAATTKKYFQGWISGLKVIPNSFHLRV